MGEEPIIFAPLLESTVCFFNILLEIHVHIGTLTTTALSLVTLSVTKASGFDL